MRFEPRLIPEPQAGDLDGPLPDDLAALAEQLSADAAHLDARYPATGAPPEIPVTHDSGAPWKRVAAAVVVAAAALGGGYLWIASPADAPRAAAHHRAGPVKLVPGETVKSLAKDVHDAAGYVSVNVVTGTPAFGSQPQPVVTLASHVEGMSSVELEGYLDLLEVESAPPEKASF